MTDTPDPLPSKPVGLGNALVPAIMLVGGVTAAVYLLFARVGQGADLLRAASEDLVRHYFLAMGLATFGAGSFAILFDAASRATSASPILRLGVPFLLSLVAPGALVAASMAVNSTTGTTIGDLLLAVAALAGPVVLALQAQGAAPRAPIIGAAWLLAVGGAAAVFVSPEWAGVLAGPLAVTVVMASAVLWMLWAVHRLQPLVALVVFVVVAVVAGMGSYGQRPVRMLEAADAGRRSDFEAHAARWLHERRGEIALSDRYPVLFVTADGGGLRAAYWTAAVLGALMDAEPSLARQTFVVSGVSGGSVGAAVFGALAAESDATGGAAGFGWRARGRQVLSADLLGAPLARLLTRDPVVSVLCGRLQWFCPPAPADRAMTLERLLEGSWRVSQGTDRLAEPLVGLQGPAQSLTVPSLMLNATEATGNRARVVSNLDLTRLLGDDVDVLARLPEGQTLALSTAAVLSARFPVITPAALVPQQRPAVDEPTLEAQVDGGYYDNSGAASAAPAVATFMRVAEAMGLRPAVIPVAVMITNDTDRTAADVELQDSICPAPPAARAGPSDSFIAVVTSPVGTLDAGRANAAESWRSRLVDAVRAGGGSSHYLPLYRCAEDGAFRVPLGWSLSAESRAWMDGKAERLFAGPGPVGALVDAARRRLAGAGR